MHEVYDAKHKEEGQHACQDVGNVAQDRGGRRQRWGEYREDATFGVDAYYRGTRYEIGPDMKRDRFVSFYNARILTYFAVNYFANSPAY